MMWLKSELFILSVIHMHAASDFQENTLVSNSYEISCDGNRAVTIVDLNVQQYTTSCSEFKQCNLTEQQSDDIKRDCSEKKSCSISKIIPNSCLFNDYGHVSVLYSCTEIVNSSCTFENGECDWTITMSENYKWTLERGETLESDTGPDKDHTTASDYGQYMYTRSYGGSQSNDESYLLSGWIVSSPKQCLTFWYHMYGKHINTLTVFQLNNEQTIELWSKSYSQGNKWYFQSLALKNIEPYRIMFKATRGEREKSEIAVDDIFITNTVCKKAIDCNFERGPCGWKTEEPTYQWTNWHDSTPTGDTGPDVDHTLGTSVGGYIYLKALGISQEQRSNLTSETVYPDGDACFTFWYHMYGRGMGTLNVYLDSEELSRIVWSKSGNHEERWWFASFDIYTSKPYTIIFEGIRGSSRRSDIALDDILLLSGSCQGAFVLDCSFEVENCYWSNYPETPYIWTITDGRFSPGQAGPYIDHTTGSAYGHYIYLKRMGPDFQKDVKSNLTSDTISPGADICFTFWYHMYGENIGTLNVYTESGHTTEMQWSQSGNQGNSWQFANFDISNSEPYRIVFEGISGDNDQGDIALDDILLLQRSCSDFVFDCSFEVGNCYWSTFSETLYIWKITDRPIRFDDSGPHNDHTTGAAYGHYIYLVPTDVESQEGVKTYLTSPTISNGSDICFTFWYHMYGENIGTINVYTESGNTTEMQWSQSGNQENSWKFANFDISISEPYRIVFEGISGENDQSDIALDDILLLQRSCSESINYSQLCHTTDESISLPECSKYYLQLNKTSMLFNPKFDDCSADYQEIQRSILNLCNDMNNSDICTFNLSNVTKKDLRCFQSNRLLVEYNCKDEETTTVSNVVASTGSSSAVSDRSVSLPSVVKKSSESETGLVVGLVIGGLVLACVVILLVVFVKRQTFVSGSNKKVRNNLRENDYIGCQDIALPQTADHSGYVQFADKQTSNDDEYAIINPSAETSFNEIIGDGNRSAESYMILDPNDTGFNRTTFSNTPTGYEFAQPVRDTGDNIGDEDQYAFSEEGYYDHSRSNRHKELENGIYNHAVDTIYDSGNHNRNNERREDTYDHFIGQKTEDDYDISTT